MKKYIAFFTMMLLALGVSASIKFELKYAALTDMYEVYFVSDISYPVANVGPSQVTVAFGAGFNVTAINPATTPVSGGGWTAQDKVTGNAAFGGTLNNRKVVTFISSGANIPGGVAAGAQYLLFRFTFGPGANCVDVSRLFVNGTDPIDPDGSGGDFSSLLNIAFTDFLSTNTDLTFRTCTMLGVVPVRFLNFTAVRSGDDGRLEWNAANEDVNTDHYEVERSVNSIDFTVITSVVRQQSSASLKTYVFTDPNIARLNANILYYRIRQYDNDGRFTYSDIRTLKMEASADNVILYPNPAKDYLNVQTVLASAEKVSVQITDAAGRVVAHTEYNGNIGVNVWSVDLRLYASGSYTLTMKNGSRIRNIPFVKIK